MAKRTLEFINILEYAVLFSAITLLFTKSKQTAATVFGAGIIIPNVINMMELKF